MKNKVSKMIALALSVVTLIGSPSYVKASEGYDVIQPRASLCLDCGYGQMIMKYGSWESRGYGEQKCSHYPYGTDKVRYEERTIGYQCNYCGSYLSQGVQSRTVIVECHGYH